VHREAVVRLPRPQERRTLLLALAPGLVRLPPQELQVAAVQVVVQSARRLRPRLEPCCKNAASR
jgi:hypothetical protein